MFQLVSANHTHLEALVDLVSMTGAYKVAMSENREGLDYREFMRRLVILPLLHYAHVLVDDAGQVAGTLICGTTAEINRDALDLAPYLNEDILQTLAEPVTSLDIPTGFFIHSLALYPQQRRQGLGRQLFEAAQAMAKAARSPRLLLTVWANDVPAIALYLSAGMVVTDLAKMKRADFPCLLLMEKRDDILSYAQLCEGRVKRNGASQPLKRPDGSR